MRINLKLFRAHFAVVLLLGASRLLGQTPFISDFTPKYGSPGDTITVYGNNFTAGNKITFYNGQVATTIVLSSGQISATVPSGVSTGPLSITGGSFSSSSFTVVWTGPYITDFSPLAGAVNDTISVNGVHFTGATAVKFGGVNASFSLYSGGTNLNATVPAGATNAPISVTTPLGTSNSPTSFIVIGAGPWISDFSPTQGSSGQQVFINGIHFTAATNATFNGVPGTGFFVSGDTQIQVYTPAGVTTGPIAVNAPAGKFTTSSNFFVPPTITGFSPATGRAGTNLIVTGTSFLGATSFLVGGVAATITSLSNTTLQVTVPSGESSGPLQITAPAGSFPTSSNFTFQPTISGFSPSIGSTGTNVTINGFNLNENLSSVKFNGVSALSPIVLGPTQVTANVPATATTGPVSVTTSNGTFITVTNFFLPASITGFSPTNSLPGSRVTVSGQNFLGATAVGFNGLSASFNVTNNTILGATVPGGVITGPISVTAPAGTATSAALFYGAPVINSFLPTHGLPGTNVTILGTNFLGASAVRFNGLNAQTFSVSDNGTINATVPNNPSSGQIAVVAPAGTNTSAGSFTIDFASDLTITVTDVPDPVFVTSNLVYTIVVTNTGPFAAPNVMLTNTLSSSVNIISNMTTTGTLSTNGSQIVGSLGSIGINGSATVVLTVVPTAIGTITNFAIVASGYSDPNPAGNTSTLLTLVLPLPVLTIQPYSANQWALSWSMLLTNFNLQAKTILTTNYSWSTITTPPFILGSNQVVIEANDSDAKFYRLQK